MASKGPIPKVRSTTPRSNRGPTPHKRGPVVAIDHASGPPPASEDLGPAGRAAWDQFWTASWLIPADEIGVRLLCQVVDALEEIEAQTKAEGRTSKGSKGQPVAHPLLATANALRSTVLTFVESYGFSPMSRARLRIEVVPKREPSPLDPYRNQYAHLREDA